MYRLTSHGVTIEVRGSMLARHYYKQNFSRELDDDIMEKPYEVLWACAKAQAFYEQKNILNFDAWQESMKPFDILDCQGAFSELCIRSFLVKSLPSMRERPVEDEGPISDISRTNLFMHVALQAGLSLADMNEMTTQSFYEIVTQQNNSKESARRATADEVDRFFG